MINNVVKLSLAKILLSQKNENEHTNCARETISIWEQLQKENEWKDLTNTFVESLPKNFALICLEDEILGNTLLKLMSVPCYSTIRNKIVLKAIESGNVIDPYTLDPILNFEKPKHINSLEEQMQIHRKHSQYIDKNILFYLPEDKLPQNSREFNANKNNINANIRIYNQQSVSDWLTTLYEDGRKYTDPIDRKMISEDIINASNLIDTFIDGPRLLIQIIGTEMLKEYALQAAQHPDIASKDELNKTVINKTKDAVWLQNIIEQILENSTKNFAKLFESYRKRVQDSLRDMIKKITTTASLETFLIEILNNPDVLKKLND